MRTEGKKLEPKGTPVFTIGEDTKLIRELEYFGKEAIEVYSERGVHDKYEVVERTPYPLNKTVIVREKLPDGKEIEYEGKVMMAVPVHFPEDKYDMYYILEVIL